MAGDIEAPDISGPVPGSRADALSSALGASSPAPPPAPIPPEISGLPTAPASPVSSTSDLGGGGIQPSQPAGPDLPRFQRTFKNTLKSMLLGFEMGGVPGVAVGALDPGGVQRQADVRAQLAQEAVQQKHFENAKAAASVALTFAQANEANLASQEKQEQINLMHENAAAFAKRMGLDPTLTVSGSNPQDYHASAIAALDTVKAANGNGLVPLVVGTNSTIGTGANPGTHETAVYAPGTPKSMDAIRSVTEPTTKTVPHIVAEYYRAQGLPIPSDSDWANLGVKPENAGPQSGMVGSAQNQAAQRETIGDAAKFFMTTPPLEQGGSTELTATKNNVLLQQAKNALTQYKAMGGNDPATLGLLQTRIDTIDQQAKELLASGTAAKVAEINATAGPAAAAAGKKAGAEEAAKFPYELKLKQEEVGQNPAFAYNPKTGQRELTTIGDAKKNGWQFAKVGQPDIEKETSLNSQMNDMQLNTSRYRAALNAMGNLTASDRANMQSILNQPDIKNLLSGAVDVGSFATGGPTLSQLVAGKAAGAWSNLSPDKQDAVIGYLRMKNTGLLAQKVLTGMGRASKEALDIELANMPSPIEGATVGNKKLDAWQENLDQINSRSVKLPWMETPADVRARVEGQAVQQYNQRQATQSGKYRLAPGVTKKVGDNIQITNIPGLSRVTKVYPDGTIDASQ